MTFLIVCGSFVQAPPSGPEPDRPLRELSDPNRLWQPDNDHNPRQTQTTTRKRFIDASNAWQRI
jgi:hypothetical protein